MTEGTNKGTISQFIPKSYTRVPSVQDLMGYYAKKEVSLVDNKAFGILVLDNKERKHVYYVSVGFLMNHLNHMKTPLKVHDRVEVHYERTSDGDNLIQKIKQLPIFFEHNQAHDKDKDVPAYVRRGDRNNNKAQELTPFNPPLMVPKNRRAGQISDDDHIQQSRDTKSSMHDVFMKTLDQAQFRQRTDLLFQKAPGQTQKVLDTIFDSHYLDFTDQFNQIHEDDFIPHQERGTDKKESSRHHIDSMNL